MRTVTFPQLVSLWVGFVIAGLIAMWLLDVSEREFANNIIWNAVVLGCVWVTSRPPRK